MSASNAFELLLLNCTFQNANMPNYGDATGIRGSTVAGSLYIGLHTADPGEAGTQLTSEATYTGYARVAVARSSAGWTTSSPAGVGTVVNAAVITFGMCVAGANTITHFTIGSSLSGAGDLALSGALTASLAVSTGITPSFAAGALTATVD